MLLGGRAGIGKTRLVAELGERARSAGATVLDGPLHPARRGGLPYLPFVEALRPIGDSPAIAALAGRLHELPAARPRARRPARPETGPRPRDSRLRLFQEVFLVLETAERGATGGRRA